MKTVNNQTKPETRGRKPLKNKSKSVHCRCPHDLYQLLLAKQKKDGEGKSRIPPLSGVLMDAAKNSLI